MRYLREFEVISTDVLVEEADEGCAVALGRIRFRIDREVFVFDELIGPDGAVAAATGSDFDAADVDSIQAAMAAADAGIEIRNVLQTEVQRILQRDSDLLARVEMTFA